MVAIFGVKNVITSNFPPSQECHHQISGSNDKILALAELLQQLISVKTGLSSEESSEQTQSVTYCK